MLAQLIADYTFSSLVAAIAAAGILGGLGTIVRMIQNDRKERHQLIEAVVGRAPTFSDPNPPAGLAARVDQYHDEVRTLAQANVDRKNLGDGWMAEVRDRLDQGAERMDELQGAITMGAVNTERLEDSLRIVSATVSKIDAKVTKLFPNGKDTNEPGDLMARMAESQGVWLEDPKQSHG